MVIIAAPEGVKKMQDIRLVALDLDGTVFNDKKEITPRTLAAIRNAVARGVAVLPATGRTHQLRVHLAAIGHPLAGDWLYGTEDRALIARPALHSYILHLRQPLSGADITVTAPIPGDMTRLIQKEAL